MGAEEKRTVALTVRITPGERNAFRAYCALRGKPMSAVLREYIEDMGATVVKRDEEARDGE